MSRLALTHTVPGRTEKGKWRLTETGLQKIEAKKAKWTDLEDPERREKLLADFEYCTTELFDWMLKIAKGDSLLLTKK